MDVRDRSWIEPFLQDHIAHVFDSGFGPAEIAAVKKAALTIAPGEERSFQFRVSHRGTPGTLKLRLVLDSGGSWPQPAVMFSSEPPTIERDLIDATARFAVRHALGDLGS